MVLIGILCGLVTAVCQSMAYIFSRRFVLMQHASAVKLLVLGHFMMGVVSVLALTLLGWQNMPPLSEYGLDVVAASLPYFVGQIGLFLALRKTDASRVSPLLGLKVVFVAVIAVSVMGRSLEALQWMAVAIAAGAAFVLNGAGGRLPMRTTAVVMMTCLLYAASDIHIAKLIEYFSAMSFGKVWGSIVAALVCYVFCGVISTILLPIFGSRKANEWLAALPYATCWIVAMMFMFVCYSYAGVILGVIVISMRGLISIAMGVLIAKLGWLHLEGHVTRGILARRCVAAMMMLVAVGLYLYGRQG